MIIAMSFIISHYGSMAEHSHVSHMWTSIFLVLGSTISFSDIVVLYPSLDGVSWPLFLWIISHTEIYIRSWTSTGFMDYNTLVSDRLDISS